MPLCAQPYGLSGAPKALGEQVFKSRLQKGPAQPVLPKLPLSPALQPAAIRNQQRYTQAVTALLKKKVQTRLPALVQKAKVNSKALLPEEKENLLYRHKIDIRPVSDDAFIKTCQEIDALKQQYVPLDHADHFHRIFLHSQKNTPVLHWNNLIVLKTLQNYIQKIKWLQNYPNQGRDALKSDGKGPLLQQLANHLQDKQLIFVGEFHFTPVIQNFVENLVLTLQKQNPHRRVVLFTEFLFLKPQNLPSGTQLSNYYRPANASTSVPVFPHDITAQTYAQNTFSKLLQKGIEIYPLEDMALFRLAEREMDTDFLLHMSLRNKTWARVIQRKMAEIRRTDPDALFIVYAGMAHTSWMQPYALPKFFAGEKSAVVEAAVKKQFQRTHMLTNVWTPQDPFFSSPRYNTVFYWTGPDAKKLARVSGFDYHITLSENLLLKLSRYYQIYKRAWELTRAGE